MAIMHIMLDLTDDLFYQFADSLPSLQAAVDPALYPPLIRFFAHLVLYLRLLGKNPPIEPARDILQAYLDVLEREGKGELVAVYAGSLGERKGEESYARFLRGQLLPCPGLASCWTSTLTLCFPLRRPRPQHQQGGAAPGAGAGKGARPGSRRGRQADGAAADDGHLPRASSLASLCSRSLPPDAVPPFLTQSLPGSDEPEPDITSFATSVVEGGDDWRLIRALEWLTISDETFSEALIQANSLTRYFLGESSSFGRRCACAGLTSLRPSSSVRQDPRRPRAPRRAAAATARLLHLGRGLAGRPRDARERIRPARHAVRGRRQPDQVPRDRRIAAQVKVRPPAAAGLPGRSRADTPNLPFLSDPKIDQLDWAKRLSAAVNKSYASTVDLLQSDWLKFESDESSLLGESAALVRSPSSLGVVPKH